MLNQQVDRELVEKRINLVRASILACFLIFFSGFWYLQVIRGPYYEDLAKANILRDSPLPAPRGLILDRNNQILAENRLSHNLFLTPGVSRNLRNTLGFLANVLSATPEEFIRQIQREGSVRSLRPVLIYQDLNLSQLAYISARKIEYPELEIHHEQQRSYKYGTLFSHVLGYVGEISEEQQKQNQFPGAQRRDIVGQAGLERYYNHYLMGEAGFERKIVDTYGAELKKNLMPEYSKEFSGFLDGKKPVPGKVLKLSLDSHMQKAAADAFAESEQYGTAVAIDVSTGEVLALFSKPFYDPNDFVPRIAPSKWRELISNPQHPLQNRVIQNKFSPGSTFKIVMALAALQEKKITPTTTFSCSGSQFIYNRRFRCWKPGGHGAVDLHRAIMQSCDVYFYNVGMRMDIDLIASYAKQLGLGSATTIDLPNETRGLVPSREWKRRTAKDKWYPGETISVAIGQGPLLVTAIQLATLMAEVSRDGYRIQPHLLGAILNLNGKILETPRYRTEQIHGIDPVNYEIVKKALWGVVNEWGTGGKARIDGYDVCGKTGTVQVVGYDRGGDLSKKQKEKYGDHAWFIGFAPLSNPQVAIAAFVEHGGHGSDTAAPIARKVLETFFKERNIPPFSPLKSKKPVPVSPAPEVTENTHTTNPEGAH